MIHIFLLFNRQGKIRLQKWYDVYTAKDQRSIIRELTTTVMKRTSNMSNILEWRNLQVVYKRYASLYILLATSKTDNELLTLELIHRYVEALDLYFGNVCELDIVFNFNKVPTRNSCTFSGMHNTMSESHGKILNKIQRKVMWSHVMRHIVQFAA